MSDRIHSLTVVLDQDIRDDDVQPIIEAIGQLRHVLKVTPRVANMDSHMAEQRAKQELGEKLWAVLKND